MIYFTSDTHFGHDKLFIWQDRGFSSISEHDQAIIDTWNSRVSKNDEVYHLGDISWHSWQTTKRILDCLSGKKYLVRGNHDNHKNIKHFEDSFVWTRNYYELKYNKQHFILSHYPIESWNKKFHGSAHLHGHIHNSEIIQNISNRLNIGIDKFPNLVSIDEISHILNSSK